MIPVRLGAVGYLNARPLVYGLEGSPRFTIRFDVPSACAALLHAGEVDVGLIPSIEYLYGDDAYRIVPDVAIASRGPVASVALFTTKPVAEIRSIATDNSSRASAALLRVLCERQFKIDPVIETKGPDLQAMLGAADAALIIGDTALLLEHTKVLGASERSIEKIDLGEVWTRMTGLPFVYAFWAGRPSVLDAAGVRELQQTRDIGATQPEMVARHYFSDSVAWQAVGARYLRDNIKYYLGSQERAGLELFYRYAAEIGIVPRTQPLKFY